MKQWEVWRRRGWCVGRPYAFHQGMMKTDEHTFNRVQYYHVLKEGGGGGGGQIHCSVFFFCCFTHILALLANSVQATVHKHQLES